MTRKQHMAISAVVGAIFILINLAIGSSPFPITCYFIGLILGVFVAPEK